jgi:hypothetical protein
MQQIHLGLLLFTENLIQKWPLYNRSDGSGLRKPASSHVRESESAASVTTFRLLSVLGTG